VSTALEQGVHRPETGYPPPWSRVSTALEQGVHRPVIWCLYKARPATCPPVKCYSGTHSVLFAIHVC
jgi:hypothetical protein